MTTVRMKKGDKFADIYDSPETIKQAQLEGYSIIEQKKTEQKTEKAEEKVVEADSSKNTETEKVQKRTSRQ